MKASNVDESTDNKYILINVCRCQGFKLDDGNPLNEEEKNKLLKTSARKRLRSLRNNKTIEVGRRNKNKKDYMRSLF